MATSMPGKREQKRAHTTLMQYTYQLERDSDEPQIGHLGGKAYGDKQKQKRLGN